MRTERETLRQGAAMATDAVRDRLTRILAERLKYPFPGGQIREDMPLHGRGLGLDSVDVVSLVVKIEEEFAIFFEAEEVAKCVTTFGSLLGTIRHKLGGDDRPKQER